MIATNNGRVATKGKKVKINYTGMEIKTKKE